MTMGKALGIAILLAVLALLATCAIDLASRMSDDRAAHEGLAAAAREEGYAECLSDVLGVVSDGGGIDEVLAFARSRADGISKGEPR